jgi:proteasome accessory factor C
MTAPVGGAKEQVARLLALVPYLHRRGEVQLDEAAAALGVPADQLLRDLRVLLMCGLPGGYPDDLIDVDLDALESPEGDGVIRVSNADYLMRPLRLTPTEASALIVALRAVRTGANDATRAVVDRTLSKLETAAAQGSVAPQIEVGEDVDRHHTLRATLNDAIASRRQVRLTYFVPSRDEESERVVDPHAVITANGFAYLDAWCHSAEAPRWFRLDRISSVAVTDHEIATTVSAPRSLSDGLFAAGEHTTRVVLRLAAPARWVPDYYPVQDVRRMRDGSLKVTLQVSDPRWLERLLLRLAPHAEVESPVDFADSFHATATAALQLYAGTP